MSEMPDAGREEFGAMLESVRPRCGEFLCDLPSGGGYVQRYLEGKGVDVVSVETSEVFYELCRSQTQGRVGLFSNEETPREVEGAGFRVLRCESSRYRWQLPDSHQIPGIASTSSASISSVSKK